MNSNNNLTVPRTSFDAFGYWVRFAKSDDLADRMDRAVFVVMVVAVAFILGLLAGAA